MFLKYRKTQCLYILVLIFLLVKLVTGLGFIYKKLESHMNFLMRNKALYLQRIV